MLVMISSSSTNLYKADVIRVLAYPQNTTIQFRYESKWIEKQSDINLNEDVLICYLDAMDYSFIPIRLSKIQSFEKIGKLFFIKLRLLNYPDIKNIGGEDNLLGRKKELLNSKQNQNGKFVITIDSPSVITNPTAQDQAWFDIVDRVSNCNDMKNVDFFYRIFPLKDKSNREVEFDSNEELYLLSSDNHYCFKILSYHPNKRETGTIRIDETFMSDVSSSEIQIDSRYDLSDLSIKTEMSYYTDKYGYYRISCKLYDDFEIRNTFRFKIKSNIVIKIVTIIIFAVILTLIHSLFDEKAGIFDISITLEYALLSALIVFVGQILHFLEYIQNLFIKCYKRIFKKHP